MTAPTRPDIGDQIRINEVNERLPIGTVVSQDDRTFTKTNEEEWTRSDDGPTYNAVGLTANRTIVSYPDEPGMDDLIDPRPAVGERVRIDQVNGQLPVGTVAHFADVTQSDFTTYTKTEGNRWARLTGGHATSGTDFSRSVIIDSYPDDEPAVEQYRLYTLESDITTEELDHLPPGTEIRDRFGRGIVLTRGADGDWFAGNGSRTPHASVQAVTNMGDGGIRVASLPRMTSELWRSAPVGSAFYYSSGVNPDDVADRWIHPTVKRADAWYCNGQPADRDDYTLDLYRLVWWGDGVETATETDEVPPFTRVTHELMNRMPVGSQVMCDGSEDTPFHRWQKQENGAWRRSSSDGQTYVAEGFTAHLYSTVRWGYGDETPPVTAPVAASVGPQVGDRTSGRSDVHPLNMNDLPVGTVVADYPDRTYRFTKLEDERWERSSDSVAYSVRDFTGSYVIESIPVMTPPQIQAQVEAMQQRIITCIDGCVNRQGGFTGDVRDGAWMKLGFSNLPARGDRLAGRAAYGLPNNSIVEQSGELFRIDDSRDWPERFRFEGQPHTKNYRMDVPVEVIWVSTAERPIYYSALDLLHKFWLIYSKMRPLHRWCEYVDAALTADDLANPGEQPQSFAEVAVEPELAIELGPLNSGQLSEQTQRRVLAAFRAMPAGSVCHGNEVYVKTAENWVTVHGLRPAFHTAATTFINVTIDFIPEVSTAAEQLGDSAHHAATAEPF